MSHVTICDATNGVGARLIVSVVSETVMLERIMPASANMMRLPERPASSASVSIDERAADERERRQQKGEVVIAEVQRKHRTERRARRDAEETRVGERIAQVALHRGAGEAECSADDDRQHRSRQAQLRDDQPARIAQRPRIPRQPHLARCYGEQPRPARRQTPAQR